ncbi:MAG: single-stranded-DNA-specific exonuclease RecJ [bacterium]
MEKYSDILRTLFLARGIENETDAELFLNGNYERDFHDPFLMRDMEKTCVRIYEAMEANEKIVIYSDYDCDGIPGAVIMHDLFEKVGYKNYEIYIPGRNNEGYGLNMEAIEEFAKKDVKLLITIDLGITAISEVLQAEVYGIDVIITDHHIPHENLPRAYAILNPKVDDYPEKMLCGAGVIFKLVQGFVKKYGEYFKINNGWEKWMLDMAGLATLSDMVPLVGENRVIAHFGIKVLRKSPRLGLQKLLAQMKIDQRYLTEDDVGFMISPRLNAASRMDNPLRAYELLSTTDAVEAGTLATHLTKINDERKSIVAGIMREVKKKFETRTLNEIIVIGNPAWRVGVLGLVAGKIADEYEKTVFVWGKDENECIKGSCRSNGSISIVELMTNASGSFLEFGGHEMAGGFSVHADKIHYLEEALLESLKKVKKIQGKEKEKIDITGDLSLVSMKNWKEIEKLSPFGLANPKPIFSFPNLKIEKIKKFGKNGSGEHLEITFSDVNNKKAVAISFFSNHESFSVQIEEGKMVNLLATFDLSRFRGREELRLRIIDILSTI